MNFWKYTFRGKFLYYAAIALLSCIAAALPLYMQHQIAWVYTIFGTYLTLFFFSVARSFYRWKQYMVSRFEGLRKLGLRKFRLN